MLRHAISSRRKQHVHRDRKTRARRDGKYISFKKICTSVVSRDKQWQAVHFSNFRSPTFLSILFSSEQWIQFIDIEELRRGKHFPFFLSSFLFLKKDSWKRFEKALYSLINVVNVRDDVARIVLLFDDCSNNSRVMMAAYLLNSGQIEYYFESACITVQARAPSKPTLLSITHISEAVCCSSFVYKYCSTFT